MPMTEEYGPPIAVNGKRPEWLGDDERCLTLANFGDRTWHAAACQASRWIWNKISHIRLRADHPYYQSAEYRAATGFIGEDDRGYVYGVPVFDLRPAMTEAEMIAALEATGHTVTPPDPLVAEREFLAGLFESFKLSNRARLIRDGVDDTVVPAAMAYLRANKGRL